MRYVISIKQIAAEIHLPTISLEPVVRVYKKLYKPFSTKQMQQGAHHLVWDAKAEKGNAVVAGMMC